MRGSNSLASDRPAAPKLTATSSPFSFDMLSKYLGGANPPPPPRAPPSAAPLGDLLPPLGFGIEAAIGDGADTALPGMAPGVGGLRLSIILAIEAMSKPPPPPSMPPPSAEAISPSCLKTSSSAGSFLGCAA